MGKDQVADPGSGVLEQSEPSDLHLRAAIDLVAEAYEAVALADQRTIDAEAENKRLYDLCMSQKRAAEERDREIALLVESSFQQIKAAEKSAETLRISLQELCDKICRDLRQQLSETTAG